MVLLVVRVLWQVRRVARSRIKRRRRGIEVFDEGGGDDVGGLRLVIMLAMAAEAGNSGAAAVTVWWRGRRGW